MNWNMYHIIYEKEDGTCWRTTHYCSGEDNARKWFREQYPECQLLELRVETYIIQLEI